MNYSTPPRRLIKAASVWTATGQTLSPGAVLVEGTQIAAIYDADATRFELSKLELNKLEPGQPEVIDLPDCVLTPGLFNLHTHLDYSQASAIETNIPLFTWMARLVADSRSWPAEAYVRSARWGAEQAALAGTTYVVDSSFTGQPAEALAGIGLKGLVGLELFGLDGTAAERIFAFWQKRYQTLMSTASGALRAALNQKDIELTIAPHAPYTVSPELWKMAQLWARDNKVMLTAHLAESKEEAQWIASGNDILDQYLGQVMPPNPDKPTDILLKELPWRGQGRTPTAHLAHFDLLGEDLLAAHCVNLSDEDCRLFATSGSRAALCKRSNERLLTGPAPAANLESAGIRFGLGTDSLASCTDLNLLREAATWLASSLPAGEHEIKADGLRSGEEALKLITIKAAEAVNLAAQTGSIEIGKCADLAAFPLALADFSQSDIARTLLERAPLVDSLMVNGQFVVRSGKIVRRHQEDPE